MRFVLLGGVFAVFLYMCLYANSLDSHAYSASKTIVAESRSAAPVDFEREIKPIFQARCQPCHFSGGVMYERLPFDRSETIKQLGDKLFTRIKNEKEQQLIREFLKQ